MCKNTSMREEISRDNQDTSRYTWLHHPIGLLGGERWADIVHRGSIVYIPY